ncbi:hypothetical protein Adt_39578 [Abeliophyllum distichum]|uniref:Uncharacterized protein n=1 Tax=Abeliophyllum distichum TaxID=126358 RepID=A0ABD1Q6J1_9LAMI
MSSGSNGSQNRSNVRTNPSIQDESPLSPSSFEAVGKGRKRTDAGVLEMRGSLDKRDAPAARALDEKLRHSATEESMARSRITVEELEDLRLSYDIPSSITLRAPGPEERADDPPEGFVAIYEPTM